MFCTSVATAEITAHTAITISAMAASDAPPVQMAATTAITATMIATMISCGGKHRVRIRDFSPTGAQIKVKAQVTERVGPGTTFIPFHFSGWWQGKDMLEFYPEGAHPIVRAEAVNTATTYGYDAVTMMQETKTTLCQVEKQSA